MKKTLMQISTVIGCVVLFAVVSTHGQTSYKVNIPFDFYIGAKSYSAGEFSVRLLSGDPQSRVIVVRDANGRNSYAILPTLGGSRPEKATLAFSRYDDLYYLKEISTPTYNATLSISKSEARIAQAKKPARETLALIKKN